MKMLLETSVLPLFSSVEAIMLTGIHKLQVLYSVISLYSIYMVNMLFSMQFPSYVFFHNVPMLKYPFAVNQNVHIPLGTQASSTFPAGMLFPSHSFPFETLIPRSVTFLKLPRRLPMPRHTFIPSLFSLVRKRKLEFSFLRMFATFNHGGIIPFRTH